jgi:hypothetical protein
VDLGRGQPILRQAEGGRADAEVVLPLEIARDRLDAGEADLDPDLAQTVGEDDALDADREVARACGQAADEEVAVTFGRVPVGLGVRGDELAKFGSPDVLVAAVWGEVGGV